jgi:hypothetical protein
MLSDLKLPNATKRNQYNQDFRFAFKRWCKPVKINVKEIDPLLYRVQTALSLTYAILIKIAISFNFDCNTLWVMLRKQSKQ